MKARIEREWRVACYFGRDEVARIAAMFESLQQMPSIRVRCKKGLTLTPRSYEELFEINNSGKTIIQSVRLSSPFGAAVDMTLTFDGGGYPPVELDLEGEQADVLRLSGEVEDLIAGCRLWHGITARVQGPLLFSGSFAALFTSGMFLIVSAVTRRPPPPGTLWAFGSLILGVIVLSPFFFPRCIFLIGKGVSATDTYSKRRTQLFGGVLLATCVSVLVAYFVHRVGW